MQPTDDGLTLTVQPYPPKFVAERRYISLELAYAEKQLKGFKGHAWLSPVRDLIGVPSLEKWQHYCDGLKAYAAGLDAAEQELKAGLIPFHIAVVNNTSASAQNLKIWGDLEDATIEVGKFALERPPRVDGAPLPGKTSVLDIFSGFMRSHEKVSPQRLQAQFSKLEPGDGALVINRPVYIHLGKTAKLVMHVLDETAGELVYDVDLLPFRTRL